MKSKIVQLFETDLRTGQKTKVEILIYVKNHYIDPDIQTNGDIYQCNGVIRYVFNKVPQCLFYSQNRTSTKTALSTN